jgi:hypothetical protein
VFPVANAPVVNCIVFIGSFLTLIGFIVYVCWAARNPDNPYRRGYCATSTRRYRISNRDFHRQAGSKHPFCLSYFRTGSSFFLIWKITPEPALQGDVFVILTSDFLLHQK